MKLRPAQSSLIALGVFLIVSTIGSAMETASLRRSSPTPGLDGSDFRSRIPFRLLVSVREFFTAVFTNG
jgi:hypothetical protein